MPAFIRVPLFAMCACTLHLARGFPKQFQQSCAAVLRPELRKSMENEQLLDFWCRFDLEVRSELDIEMRRASQSRH